MCVCMYVLVWVLEIDEPKTKNGWRRGSGNDERRIRRKNSAVLFFFFSVSNFKELLCAMPMMMIMDGWGMMDLGYILVFLASKLSFRVAPPSRIRFLFHSQPFRLLFSPLLYPIAHVLKWWIFFFLPLFTHARRKKERKKTDEIIHNILRVKGAGGGALLMHIISRRSPGLSWLMRCHCQAGRPHFLATDRPTTLSLSVIGAAPLRSPVFNPFCLINFIIIIIISHHSQSLSSSRKSPLSFSTPSVTQAHMRESFFGVAYLLIDKRRQTDRERKKILSSLSLQWKKEPQSSMVREWYEWLPALTPFHSSQFIWLNPLVGQKGREIYQGPEGRLHSPKPSLPRPFNQFLVENWGFNSCVPLSIFCVSGQLCLG